MIEDAKFTIRLIWYGAVVTAFIAGVTTLGWLLYPVQLDAERQGMKHSHQYIEAKQSELLKLAEDYEACEVDIAKYRAADSAKFKDVIEGLKLQQEAILAKLRGEAKSIPSDEVPVSIRKYLR